MHIAILIQDQLPFLTKKNVELILHPFIKDILNLSNANIAKIAIVAHSQSSLKFS